MRQELQDHARRYRRDLIKLAGLVLIVLTWCAALVLLATPRLGFIRLSLPLFASLGSLGFVFRAAKMLNRTAARWLSVPLVLLCGVATVASPETTIAILEQPGLHLRRTSGFVVLLLVLGCTFIYLPYLRRRVLFINVLVGALRTSLTRDLFIVFLLAFGFRVIWATLVPPWQAPDEGSHFSYVGHIVENAELPHQPPYQNAYPTFSVEFGESWTETLMARISTVGGASSPDLPFFPISYDYSAAQEYRAPAEQRLNQAAATATPYPPLYYVIMAIPYKLFQNGPVLSRLYATRIGSGAISALSCVFAYLLAYQIFRSRHWGMALGLAMAFFPMGTFIGSSVNNDAAMICATTALLWLTARALQAERVTQRLLIAMGVTSGIILLVKPTGGSVVAIAGISLLVKCWPLRWRQGWLSWNRVRQLALYAAPIVGLYSLLVLVRIASTPSTGTATLVGMDVPVTTQKYSLLDYIVLKQQAGDKYFMWLFVKTLWGVFGWLEVYMPDTIYSAIFLCCVIGLAGAAISLVWLRAERGMVIFLSATILAHIGFVFLVVDYFLGFSQNGVGLGLQGRYFSPVLAPFLLLLICGWHLVTGRRKLSLFVLPSIVLVIQGIALATITSRYYGVGIGW
jgi:hypothetical protein